MDAQSGLQDSTNPSISSQTHLQDLIQWTSLPAREEDKPPKTTSQNNGKSGLVHENGNAGTVLVVDDDVLVNELTSQLLQRYGYSVYSAFSGEEALGLYRERKSSFDLIMLDLSMPGMGGFDCLRELVRLDPAVRVIVTSGYSDDEKKEETLQAGALGFVGKPFQSAELLETVTSVLR